jgi:hypothetical protein
MEFIAVIDFHRCRKSLSGGNLSQDEIPVGAGLTPDKFWINISAAVKFII